MDFICSQCACCCKRVGLLQDHFKEMGFPYKVNLLGACEMLGDDNKCKVYDHRPDCCSMEKLYYNHISKTGATKKSFYLENTKLCNEWIKEDGMDEKYLLSETPYL